VYIRFGNRGRGTSVSGGVKSWVALVVWVVLGVGASPRQPVGVHDRIGAHIAAQETAWLALRRDLHRHPELSGEEVRTARVVAEALRRAGLDVQTGIGGHGVVGMLTGGRPGPLVAYRADMDAVRSSDPDPVEFRSAVPGVRHICGHDVHVTIGLALASALASVKADLPGRVMFIFQPAEERATGARAMLDAGLFARDRPAAIFGLHVAPFDAGMLSSTAGLMMHPNHVAPGVTNDAGLFAQARADVIARVGPAAWFDLKEPPPGFSEDFGAFQAQVPGVFFFLGAGNTAAGVQAMPHSPSFVVDEAAIGFGVRAMAAAVVGRLVRTDASGAPASPSRVRPLPLWP
jgi:metal-dependent amidase/aminoacylase/carboxypeptidase family protein